ncbi:MAG: hypothetical protein L6Q54_13930 [Leptospiraceae bacterium]|nr:hypothetical protein [Leptospiraceae bacterium]MCK6382334.1 hypothetical protein [Leptospiraceae bacterium]NUM40892.1 hypothetical protein [Leptospiraceae bacterium]
MKIILSISFVFLLSSCIVSHSNNNLIEYEWSSLDSKIQLVTKSYNGNALILGMLPTGEEPDTKLALLDLMTENKCKDLKNIEIEFYQRNFILVGFPRMIISAQCLK